MSTYFDGWAWSTNSSNSRCPGVGLGCQAPNACARDPIITKWYCCSPSSDPFNVCWTGSTTCSSDGATFECSSGQNKWCCISKREVCTPANGQINVCWSAGYNTLKNISAPALGSAYSSLSAAAPSSASYISFDPLSLIAQTAPPSSSTSTSQTSAVDSIPKTSNTGGPAQTDPAAASPGGAGPSPAGLGTGAVTGIAIGIAAGIVLAAISVFFLWRHNKAKLAAAAADSHSQEYQQLQQGHRLDGSLLSSPHPSEMQGSTPQRPYPYSYYEAEGKPAHYTGRPELWGNAPSIELPPSNTPVSELNGSQSPRPR